MSVMVHMVVYNYGNNFIGSMVLCTVSFEAKISAQFDPEFNSPTAAHIQ